MDVSHTGDRPDEPGAHISEIRARIRSDMVSALMSSPDVYAGDALRLLIQHVELSLDRQGMVREHAIPRHHVLELVKCCAGDPRGFSSLAKEMDLLWQGTEEAKAVLRCADEWIALSELSELCDSWDFLSRTLDPPVLSERQRRNLLRLAVDDQSMVLPDHTTTLWSDFLYLAGRNTASGRLPPWMFFLDNAAAVLPRDEAEELRARNRGWARMWGMGGQLDRERASSLRGASAARYHLEYLVIRIEPDPLDAERYTVSHRFLSEARGRLWERGESREAVSFDDLERTVSEVVSGVEAVEGDRPGMLRLEFVLPLELLNLPVDWWPFDAAEEEPVPLTTRYPVVLRSLDRLLKREWHGSWRLRWNRLRHEPMSANRIYMRTSQQQVIDMQMLAGQVNDPDYFALVLSEPPVPGRTQGQREMKAALREGYPVVIWHRENGSTTEFRQALAELLAEGLDDLPTRITAYRRLAAASAPNERADHIGRHLAVLWDDPDRKPF